MRPRSPAHAALGRAIRDLREQRGISQEGLGLEIGLDRTYVGGVERGERNPTYEALRAFARGLGVKTSQIVARAEKLER